MSALLRTLTGHTNFVGALAAMPDDRTLVSSSEDGTIRVWDLHTGDCKHVLTAHKSAVNCIALNADATRLVSASDDHSIKVWNTADWSVVRTIKGHTNYVSRVALTPNDGLISCGKDGTVRIWDMPSGREFACFDWNGAWVTEIAISPDGNTAVCSSVNNVMKVYDVERGKEVRTLVDGSAGFVMIPGFDLFISGKPKDGVGHDSGAKDIAFTPDGKNVVSVEKEVIVWDFETGKEVSRGAKSAWGMDAILIATSGRMFLGGKTVQIQDAKGRMLAEMRGHQDGVKSLAFTPDGKILASGSSSGDGAILVWDVGAALAAGVPAGHTARVQAAVISPDGTRALTGGSDGTARMWDVASGAELFVFAHDGDPFVDQIAFTPDGARAVTTSHDGLMRLWDARTGEKAGELRHESPHYSFGALAVTPDGRHAIAGEVGDDFTRWDLTGASTKPESATGTMTHVQALVLTRDGKRAVATGFVGPDEPGAQGPLRVWDLDGMKMLSEMFVPAAYYPMMVLSADERLAIAATDKGRLDVWDLRTAARVREIEAHPGSYLSALHRLPDGTLATMDSKEGATDLRIWNVETGELVRSARIPHGAGRGAVFSKDGSFVVLAGASVAVWDLRTGETRATFTGASETSTIALGPDQRTIVAGGVDGSVAVFRLE